MSLRRTRLAHVRGSELFRDSASSLGVHAPVSDVDSLPHCRGCGARRQISHSTPIAASPAQITPLFTLTRCPTQTIEAAAVHARQAGLSRMLLLLVC